MLPMLKSALRPGWIDRTTLQFGVTPAHAVVLEHVDARTRSFLSLLDGRRTVAQLRRDAVGVGLGAGRAERLLTHLARSGLLDDAGAHDRRLGHLRRRAAALERLRPDLASLTVTARSPGEASARLEARHRRRVQVRGAGRVGVQIATALAGAGVGAVEVFDGGCVAPADLAPGGLGPSRLGLPRSGAARRAVSGAAPAPAPASGAGAISGAGAALAAGPSGPPPDLVVLAPRDALYAYHPDEATSRPYLGSGVAHLYAGVLEATGFVGPLVVPGVTACAGCLRRGRALADPAGQRLLDRWSSGRPRGTQACDLTLATTVAGFAAAQALVFLDRHGETGRRPGGGRPGQPGRESEPGQPGFAAGTGRGREAARDRHWAEADAPVRGVGCDREERGARDKSHRRDIRDEGDVESPATAERWELSLPGLRWQSRTLRPHRQCPCSAASAEDERELTAEGRREHATMGR